MVASDSASERGIAHARQVAVIVAALLWVGCAARDDVSALDHQVTAPEEPVQMSTLDTGLDDKLFTPLSQVLQEASDIVLGESRAVSENGRRITFLIRRAAKGALRESTTLTIPHPRLAASEDFADSEDQTLFVYVLTVDAAGEWRTPEFGEESVFRVKNGQVLIPRFYQPGVALPAEGPATAVPLEAFFSVTHTCQSQDKTWCVEAIRRLFTPP